MSFFYYVFFLLEFKSFTTTTTTTTTSKVESDSESQTEISSDENNVHRTFSRMKIDTSCIKSMRRLGKRSSEINARPRPVEVELKSKFDKRKKMSNVGLLKGTKLFVKQKLLWRDRMVEKSLPDTRYKLN